MYYIHYISNHGCLAILLPGNTDWTFFDVEYAIDRLFNIRDSKAKSIPLSDLPKDLTSDFDFNRTKESIREIFKLT